MHTRLTVRHNGASCFYENSTPVKTYPHLLFLITEDWFFCSHFLPLAVAARTAGFNVTVVTREREHSQIIRESGITLIPFDLSRRGGNPFSEISNLVQLYQREQPDIIHHLALKPVLYGSIAAHLAGIHTVINAVLGLGWLFVSDKAVARMLRPIIRNVLTHLLASQGNRTIVENPDDQAFLLGSGVPKNSIHLIRGAGVDTNCFSPRPELPGTPLVVLPARMLRDKGVAEFVKAARILRGQGVQARFALVGAPDPANPASIAETELRAWVAEGVVEWWGHRDDMPEVYAACHVVCLPSYREGLPKALLEAAACGRAIVTTDAPGCREIVREGENGLLVPVRDAAALAIALRRLLEDGALRRDMGARGRAMAVADFSVERVVNETLALYRELV